MQSDSRLLALLYGAALGLLIPAGTAAAAALARRVRVHDTADAFVAGFLALRPKYLDALAANMGQVLGRPAHHPEVLRLAREAAFNNARAWADLFRFGQRPRAEALALLADVEGLEHLEALRERGGILLTAHLGSFELGGLLLEHLGLKVHTVYKPDRFPVLERVRTRMRRLAGVEGIAVGDSAFAPLPVLARLREGGLVAMQGDRDFNLTGLPVPFFGAEVPFPRGPWELALLTGAPVVEAYLFLDADRSFRARFHAPQILAAGRNQRAEILSKAMRGYAARLEALVQEHPEQWYCFYPFWDDPLRKDRNP
jgi:KDO2-lipid IV(A) lauroyltransferase